MHQSPSLLLADLGDVLSGLLPIILFVLYGIAQLVGNFQQEKRKAPPRARPVQPPREFGGGQAAPNPPAGNQPNLEETLRREVEEFLRRAQGQQPPQQQRKGQPQQQRPGQRPQRGNQRPTLPQTRRQPEPTATTPDRPRRLVEMQRPEPAASITPLSDPRPLSTSMPLSTPTPLSTGVSLHAQTLVDHAHALGADVALADERMEEHLRQKFEHRVGAIAPSATLAQRTATATAAQQLRTLLATPESVRQIIIASEILRRPEERWS